MTSAVILAGVVAIFLQRVGNAVAFITITVNDFWGATAVGFAAEYVGIRVLDSLILKSGAKPAAAVSTVAKQSTGSVAGPAKTPDTPIADEVSTDGAKAEALDKSGPAHTISKLD